MVPLNRVRHSGAGLSKVFLPVTPETHLLMNGTPAGVDGACPQNGAPVLHCLGRPVEMFSRNGTLWARLVQGS